MFELHLLSILCGYAYNKIWLIPRAIEAVEEESKLFNESLADIVSIFLT